MKYGFRLEYEMFEIIDQLPEQNRNRSDKEV